MLLALEGVGHGWASVVFTAASGLKALYGQLNYSGKFITRPTDRGQVLQLPLGSVLRRAMR